MKEVRSWLSHDYSANDYDSGVDSDLMIGRRRKAINELKGMLRKKCLQQIDSAMKNV